MAFDQFDNDDAITGINVTPLVDIVLVLLIIFMVTTSIIVNPAIDVDLPTAKTGASTKASPLSVVLSREGRLFLNGEPLSTTELEARVREEVARDPNVKVILSADTTLHYGRVVWLIDLMKQLGVKKYALNVKVDAD